VQHKTRNQDRTYAEPYAKTMRVSVYPPGKQRYSKSIARKTTVQERNILKS
jgi:hypothetical protein